MKVQKLARSGQTAKDFFDSIDEPVEALVGGHSFIIWPTEALAFFARALADKEVQNGLKRAMMDVKQGNFVEFEPDVDFRSSKRKPALRKRSKP